MSTDEGTTTSSGNARAALSFGVYEITHRESGKSYIGQSKSPVGRWQFHVLDAFINDKQFPLSRDLRQFGLEAFDFRFLEAWLTPEQALDREKFWIAERVNAGAPLYNSLLTIRRGFGPHGEDNPYILCDCGFETGGHVCPPYSTGKKRKGSNAWRKPTPRAHKVSPEVYDVIQRLRALDVHFRKIAACLGISVGIVHRYGGSARKPKAALPQSFQKNPQKKMGVTKVGDPDLF